VAAGSEDPAVFCFVRYSLCSSETWEKLLSVLQPDFRNATIASNLGNYAQKFLSVRPMSQPRSLHLHTIESLCSDLVMGEQVIVGDGTQFALEDAPSRSILDWYRRNREKWARNVAVKDVDAIIDVATTPPPNLPRLSVSSGSAKRKLKPVKIEAHRFGGLTAYSDRDQAPANFVLEFTKPITLLEGWNGSGKTSIANAAIWCLTGQLLRPQRGPEHANNEFECRIERDSESDASLHRLTPVTPLPDGRHLSDLPPSERILIDTWVELTFADENGTLLAPIRRSQSRTARGAVSEILEGFDELGLDPIAAHIGTTIPGLLPFIQMGSSSEFGRAITELTGLADLTELARHATRVEQRINGDFRKAREEEIAAQNEAFELARNDLETLVSEHPSLAPDRRSLVDVRDEAVEHQVDALAEHFTARKTSIFTDANLILGDGFDPSNKGLRDNLEACVSPALGQLSEISKLPSLARLVALSKLSTDELALADTTLATIIDEAQTFRELSKRPAIARRKQLYARVSSWMKQHQYGLDSPCAVCGADIQAAIDIETNRPVRTELAEALEGDVQLLSHTVQSWAEARLGDLSRSLAEALSGELRRELPRAPIDLMTTALDAELFATPPFQGSLAVLREETSNLARSTFEVLPAFDPPPTQPFPTNLGESAEMLAHAMRRASIAVQFARWQQTHRDAINKALTRIVTKKSLLQEPLGGNSPLGVKLVALSQIIKSGEPVNSALDYCARMARAVLARRRQEARLCSYDIAIAGLKNIVKIGTLAQQQVESLHLILQSSAERWRTRIYNNAYETSGHALISSDMDSTGTINFFVGSKGVSAPAQHISNASALRANLVGFFFSFWEHVFSLRGGLALMILDDPQELLDDDNRDRLARTLPNLVQIGAHLLVTTHSQGFARMSVQEGRRTDAIEHRSVHPVNANRATAETAGAVEELDRRRLEFLRYVDDAIKAQDYAVEARSFIEARLSDLFDNPAYPAYSAPSAAPSFSGLVGRLRGLAADPPNEFFRKRAVADFCADRSLAQGSSCLALLNKAHHREKSRISYKDVKDEDENLRSLRRLIEDIHEEFRRWKWRESAPSEPKDVRLRPVTKPPFKVNVYPDLAAFTGAPSETESQDTSSDEFCSTWFDDKSLFLVRNDNLGFAAPAGSLAIVESQSKLGNDRNLVIARYDGSTLARRLLRPQLPASAVALAAQTPDPRKSPPTVLADAGEMRIHRIVGVLFDDVAPPRSKQEAVELDTAPVLARIETAYRIRDDSALPLALPGQLVLGGKCVLPDEFDANIGKLIALTLTDGTSIFKRVGRKLPGSMSVLRQFESIGGLGSSEIIAIEEIEDSFATVPVMAFSRIVLGVIYES
jgi:hypothetical protein